MKYSIWFEKIKTGEKKNSYTDFGLFPKNRNKIIVGTPNLNMIDLEGRNGAYDWYNIIGYKTPFSKAEDSYEFYMTYDPVKIDWIKVYTRLIKFFNGDKMKIWLDEVSEEVAEGRVYVESYSSPNSGLSEVSLKYTLTKEIEYV